MPDIDIGSPAIDRASYQAVAGQTVILKENPANASGTIFKIEIWAYEAISGMEVATFYGSGDVYSTRDYESVGAVAAGSKQTFTGFSIDVQTGDYLGYYYTAGKIEADGTGYAGDWYKLGDYIPCTNTLFTSDVGATYSAYGESVPTGIYIGAGAKDRASTGTYGWTRLSIGNPANGSGTIDTVQVLAATAITGFRIGTFYLVSGTDYKCRDSETIGNVNNGSVQTFSGLNIDVQTGDYLGYYFSTGTIERDTSGQAGEYSVNAEAIDPGDQATYTLYSGRASSTFGTGEITVTEKSGSDSGAGTDAKISGNPIATLVKAETGSGVDTKLSRDMVLTETGSGVDNKASGNPLATLVKAEIGSGVDVLSQAEAILTKSETGSGVDTSIGQGATVQDEDSGSCGSILEG